MNRQCDCSVKSTRFFVVEEVIIYINVLPVLQIRIRDPVLFYPLDPGSRSGMNFFPDPGARIPDPRGMFFGEIFLRILVL
jgi:hypothetical protein